MIIITTFSDYAKVLGPGDQFHMSVEDETGSKVVVSETIQNYQVINFVAAFRFVDENFKAMGFHLCGIFGDTENLPKEFESAIFLDELTDQQYETFIMSLNKG